MAFTTIVSTEQLNDLTRLPTTAIVDCRFKLDDVAWGRREYETSHVPGAVYADLEHDLSGPKTGANGRHPLPDPAVLARTFSRLGIGSSDQVVAYDQNNGMFAARLWWLLRWLGHESVAVLDGGFAKWIAEGRPVRGGVEQRQPAAFRGEPRANAVLTVDDVDRLRQSDAWRLVDARAPERFRGDVEPLDRKAGHIPGAIDRYFMNYLVAQGTFRTPGQLEEQWRNAIGNLPPDRVVCYCGSGVTACHNLLALEHAGLGGARLYPGSWSEWSSDPSRPVAVGDANISDRKDSKG
jgi:thiosulfate/3-mercaptopyruvate sulfurtransferase